MRQAAKITTIQLFLSFRIDLEHLTPEISRNQGAGERSQYMYVPSDVLLLKPVRLSLSRFLHPHRHARQWQHDLRSNFQKSVQIA